MTRFPTTSPALRAAVDAEGIRLGWGSGGSGAAAPTGVAATDTATVNAAKAAGLRLQAGTYVVNPLTISTGDLLIGSGRGNTVLQLAAGTNAPMVKSAGFDGLTMTGSNTSGAGTFSIRELSLDGNAAGQTIAAPFGVGIFGYDFETTGVAIRNFRAMDGFYTEFGAFGAPGPEKGMEPRYRDIRIHDNVLTGAAWRNRGPHDAMVTGLIIYQNGSAFAGYWPETSQGTYTVAAASNGVDVATFTGAGTLTINSAIGLPTSGTTTVTVATSGGTATLTYTGVTGGNTLTGVNRVSGTGTLSTGGAVTPPSYTGSAALIDKMHVWGSHQWAVILDCTTKIMNSEIEGASTGLLLVRGGDCSVTGGRIFYLGSAPGLGIQLGDAVTNVTDFMLSDTTELFGFTGVDQAHAAISVVGTASGSYGGKVHQPTGTAVWGASIQQYERDNVRFSGGTTFPSVAAGAGAGTSPPAPTVANASDARLKVNMGTGTSPTTGTQAAVTYAQRRMRTHLVSIAPGNAATAALQPYVFNESSTGFSIGFAAAPTASQATGTYVVSCVIEN